MKEIAEWVRLQGMMMSRRQFLRRSGAVLATGVAGVSLYGWQVEPHELEVRRVSLTLGLSQRMRVVALGDIHFDPLYEDAYLYRVAGEIAALKPDLVLYTGDFITRSSRRMMDLGRLLGPGVARLGAFAVLGNHDHWTDPERVTASLQKNGIQVLSNRCWKVPGEEELYLTALDSFWAGKPDVTVFAGTPRTSRHIVLVHEPDASAVLGDTRIKLQISGHTHGGQVRLPFLGPVILPVWGLKHDEGLFDLGGRSIYVNRGIGTLRPHVRMNCRPEITVFELC